MGVIVTFLALAVELISRQEQQVSEQTRSRISDAEKGFIQIENIFREMDPYLSALYREMNPQNTLLQNLPNPPVSRVDPVQETRLENHVANIIFQQMENILQNTSELGGGGRFHPAPEWIRTWQTWFQSPRLQKMWNLNKDIFYSRAAVEWIDRNIVSSV
jgi:hypothetical protein